MFFCLEMHANEAKGQYKAELTLSPRLYVKPLITAITAIQKEKTNSGYKHNSKVSHGIFNLTFRMLQHTSSEVTVTKYDEI